MTGYQDEIQRYLGHVWFFVGGALITLLISIFDVTRRSALRLAAGCIFGGIGALLAGAALDGNPWRWMAAGVAGVVTENVTMGLFKASREFSNDPIDTFGKVWAIVTPKFSIFGGSQ